MDLLKAAHKYIDAGLAPIPIWPDKRKNPHLNSTIEYTQRLPTKDEWIRWAYRWPKANIALITGYWRNLVALDFDSHESYGAWDGMKGQTWTVATARGYHVWFELRDDPGKSLTLSDGQGHEFLLRARGGYCIVPPSIHHTGAKYKTVFNLPPLVIDDVRDITLDQWVIKSQPKPSRAKKLALTANLRGVRLEDLIPVPEGAKPMGKYGAYQVYCPFHNDSKPSAWLNIEEQRFGCNAEGCLGPDLWWDVVNIYAKLNDISNGEAYRRLNRD